ncbi:hypothetical protein ACFXKY_07895 [Streptomyces canus]|uniref:hypothetical protein n=1 Tax=Streptomyces canus TaxID=58343 RepID=UPI0036C19695
MKIVKGLGERLLPAWLRDEIRPVLAFAGAGTALCTGSVALATRGWAYLRERFSAAESLGALGAAVYVAGYGCWHAPHIARFAVPGAVVAWCVAAYLMAPPAVDAPEPEPQASNGRDGFLRWLIDLIGERPGIHLRDLYPAMRTLPGHEDRDNGQLRAALRALGIPVRRSLRLGGVAGRSGVALADLQTVPSPPGELTGDSDGDAGQDVDSPAGESHGEQLESA